MLPIHAANRASLPLHNIPPARRGILRHSHRVSASSFDDTRRIAAEAGYRVEVFGPSQPQPMAIAAPKIITTLIRALTTLGNQAGSATTTVQVDPINRRIQVIHHV